MTDPTPERYSKTLFKKWLFVPNFSGQITVTDRFNGQHRERNLRPSDFQYEENAVPNYGMLTYVGISEISKEIDQHKEVIKDLLEAMKIAKNIPDIPEFDSAPIAQVDAMCEVLDKAIQKAQELSK